MHLPFDFDSRKDSHPNCIPHQGIDLVGCAVLALLLAAGTVGIAQTPQTSAAPARTTVPDAQIEAGVLKSLAAAPDLANQAITTTTVYGVVTLSGSVQTEALRTEAENLVARTSGVQKVVDELTLTTDPPLPPAVASAAEDPPAEHNLAPSNRRTAQPDSAGAALTSRRIRTRSSPTRPPAPAMAPAPPSIASLTTDRTRLLLPTIRRITLSSRVILSRITPSPAGCPAAAVSAAGQPQGYFRSNRYPQQQPYPQQQGYPQQQPYGQSTPAAGRLLRSAPAYAGQQAGEAVTVPAGALVRIRINQTLDSARAKPGDRFDGSRRSTMLLPAAAIAIPRGAAIQGTVVDAKKTGALAGRGELSLQLTAVTLGGISYPIVSDLWAHNGADKTVQSVDSTIVGGALGALVGAAAGGGTGAAIGAGVGGALGLGSSAASHSGQVFVPSEGLLTFHLAQPATVTTVSQAEMDRLAQGAGPAGGQQRLQRRYPAPYPPAYYRPYPYPY